MIWMRKLNKNIKQILWKFNIKNNQHKQKKYSNKKKKMK